MKRLYTALGGILALTTTAAFAQQIPSTTTAGWAVDRVAPNSFTSTIVGGQSALQLGISSAEAQTMTIPSTQGEVIGVNPTGQIGNWSLSGDIYVTPTMLAGTGGPMAPEVWATTGTASVYQSGYYILGILSGSSGNNANNVFSAAPTTGSELEIWNDTTGAWTYLSDSMLTTGWNSFDITATPSGTLNYIVDGIDVLTQTGMGVDDPDLDEIHLLRLEGYNFYGQGTMPTTGSYLADFSSLDVSVPDAWSTWAALVGGCVGLFALKQTKRFARI